VERIEATEDDFPQLSLILVLLEKLPPTYHTAVCCKAKQRPLSSRRQKEAIEDKITPLSTNWVLLENYLPPTV
jgi:hypothetical protein